MKTKLDKLRQKIQTVDEKLIKIIAKRFKEVAKIANLKKKQKVKVRQNGQWKKVLKNRLNQGKKLHLDSQFLTKIFNHIHEESIRLQNKIIKKDNK